MISGTDGIKHHDTSLIWSLVKSVPQKIIGAKLPDSMSILESYSGRKNVSDATVTTKFLNKAVDSTFYYFLRIQASKGFNSRFFIFKCQFTDVNGIHLFKTTKLLIDI